MKFLRFENGLGKALCSVLDPGTAMLLAGGASAGGNIFSSIFGASAAKQQASAIREAANTARQTALELDERARQDVAPFREFGKQAGETLTDLLFGRGDVSKLLRESELFKFQSDLGTRNLNRELSARGLYGSGAGLETLARFNSQLVAEEGQRFTDRLVSLTALGANAASHQASNTAATGRTLADMLSRSGIAQAGAIGDAGRSLASLGPGVASAVNQYAQYSLLRPLFEGFGMSKAPLGETNDDFSLTS